MPEGVLETTYDYDALERSYFLKIPELLSAHRSADFPQTKITRQVLTDAEVIIEALHTDGQITAPILCVKANVSMDTAEKKLDSLCSEGHICRKKSMKEAHPSFILKNKATFQRITSTSK